MSTVLITGSNRGIGLGLVQKFQANKFNVIAVCRHASAELEKTGARIIADTDVSDASALDSVRKLLGDTKIDILINNAGILRTDSLDQMNFDSIRTQFEVNSLAPLRVVSILLTLLEDGAKIVMITSRMGSIGDNGSGSYYGYRMSKAALNAAAVSLARDLAPRKISVGIFHPGMVNTDMTGGAGGISVDESVAGLYERILQLNMQNSGKFLHQNGEELLW